MLWLGASKSEYLARTISEHILNIMEERLVWQTKDNMIYPLLDDDKVAKYKSEVIAPIISDAEAIGSVILFSTKYNQKITDTEIKLVESTANFLGKQMEL